MSDLLNSASLVMIPSGYAEDKVYSVVPSDGSGDMAFTRASNGTRVNSAGLVEVCPWNLILQSETFNNSYWNKVNGTITSDSIVAPNGTTTADLFTITNNSAFVEKTIAGTGTLFTFIPNTQYTFSCYFKKGSIDYNFKMLMYDGVSVTNSGTINLTTPSSSTVSYEDVGNGWYRFYHTFTSSASATTGYFYAVNYDYSTTITSGTNVYLWGAQVVQGATAKPYFPTTDRLNVPRLTYQNGGGGCPSLLLEKQSTNVLTYSEQFDNAIWTKRNSTISANAITSPDGTTNADKIQEDTSNDRHDIYQDISAVSGTTYTQSIFAKKGERDYIFMSFGSSQISSANSFFNLNTGVVVSSPSGITSTITDMGNGWYRCTSTGTAVSSGLAYLVTGPSNNGTGISYQGVSGNGVFIWGAQIEASSYATSYIPSTSSSATRVADACFKTGISSLIPTEGVLFCDFTLNGFEGFTSICGVDNVGTDTTTIRFWSGVGAAGMTVAGLYAQIYYAGNILVQLISTTPNQRIKGAIRYKSGSIAVYANGSQIGTSTATFTPVTLNQLGFSRLWGITENANTTTINEVAIFPVLTNAELASLTTI